MIWEVSDGYPVRWVFPDVTDYPWAAISQSVRRRTETNTGTA